MSGPAMAIAIGYALQAPPLVLFSLAAVGYACNLLGGAGGPLAVLFVAIIAAECGKAVSKETKIDILVTPIVTTLIGVGTAYAVSYTHLDVYKRQAFKRLRGKGRLTENDVREAMREVRLALLEADVKMCIRDRAYIHNANLPSVPQVMTKNADDFLWACDVPVSYTHLDVYKRQT